MKMQLHLGGTLIADSMVNGLAEVDLEYIQLPLRLSVSSDYLDPRSLILTLIRTPVTGMPSVTSSPSFTGIPSVIGSSQVMGSSSVTGMPSVSDVLYMSANNRPDNLLGSKPLLGYMVPGRPGYYYYEVYQQHGLIDSEANYPRRLEMRTLVRQHRLVLVDRIILKLYSKPTDTVVESQSISFPKIKPRTIKRKSII